MIKIIGEELKNIPWQDRPAGCPDVVWRYSGNPIIERDAIPSSNSVFNSAAVLDLEQPWIVKYRTKPEKSPFTMAVQPFP